VGGDSIVLREQDRGGRTIGLGDDVELDAGGGVINREDPETLLEGEFVLLTVVFR